MVWNLTEKDPWYYWYLASNHTRYCSPNSKNETCVIKTTKHKSTFNKNIRKIYWQDRPFNTWIFKKNINKLMFKLKYKLSFITSLDPQLDHFHSLKALCFPSLGSASTFSISLVSFPLKFKLHRYDTFGG